MGWNVWRLGIALSPLTRFLFFSSFRFCSSRFERSRVRTNFSETCDWINYAFSFFWNLLYVYIYTSIRFIGATLLENLKLIVPLEFLFPLFKFKFSLDISLKIFHVYNFYNLEKGKICEKRYRPLWGETYRFSFIIYTVYKNCRGSQMAHRRTTRCRCRRRYFPTSLDHRPNKLFNVSQEKLSRKFDEASSLESLFLERELIYRQLVGSKDSELRTNVLITAQILVYICP